MASDDALIMKLLKERRFRIEELLDGKIKQRPFRGWRRVQLARVNAEIARRLYPVPDRLTDIALQTETHRQTELLVKQLQALQDELKALRG